MRPVNFPSDLNGYAEPFAQAPAAGRPGLRLLGCIATAAAAIGVALPLWPTTPFALLAAWAFARSSPRLEAWLRSHPNFGPAIRAWSERRAIPRKAKLVAAGSLPASWAGLWLADASVGALVASGAVLLAVGAWIVSRPH